MLANYTSLLKYLSLHLKLGGQFLQPVDLPLPLLHLLRQLPHLPPLPLQLAGGHLHQREGRESLRLGEEPVLQRILDSVKLSCNLL